MNEAAFRIRGRVQGVGFRWWTRSLADRLGLEGGVRNCEDGTVEVQVRGLADRIAEFRSALTEGPPGARVEVVEEIPFRMDTEDISGFRIIH